MQAFYFFHQSTLLSNHQSEEHFQMTGESLMLFNSERIYQAFIAASVLLQVLFLFSAQPWRTLCHSLLA